MMRPFAPDSTTSIEAMKSFARGLFCDQLIIRAPNRPGRSRRQTAADEAASCLDNIESGQYFLCIGRLLKWL